MNKLSLEETVKILKDMKVQIPLPQAAITQKKRNHAIDIAIEALNCSEMPNNSDCISRQAAIYAVEESRRLNHHQDGKEACAHEYEHRHFLKILKDLPSAQSEEDCDTCKHGYFGDAQCERCRVRYPSHYEREVEHHGSD